MNKNRILLTVLFTLIIASVSFSQKPFEGRVEYKITGDDNESTRMSYFIKEGKMKIDVAGEEENSGSMIFDSRNKKMLILMPEEKMYMEMSTSMMDSKTEESDAKDSEMKRTGQKKDILGYTCEKWVYKDDDNTVESWITNELGTFMFISDPMQGKKRPRWQSELESEGYFPMEVVVKDESGKTESTMTVTAVEKKSLDNSMFQPPKGYQKFSMPGMQ